MAAWSKDLLLVLGAAALLLTVGPCVRNATAHGPAAWIDRGAYKNAAGELCCGEKDCGVKVGGFIEHVIVNGRALGYRVDATFLVAGVRVHVREWVPESEATPSPDQDFWRCAWGGARKCFFAPQPNT